MVQDRLVTGCMSQASALISSGWAHSNRHQIPVEVTAAGSLRCFSSGEDSDSEESSDSSDSDSDDLSGLGSDSDDEDDGQWTRYREVGEGDVDEDADDKDALIPENRYQLPDGVRKAARSALGEEDWSDGEAGPVSMRSEEEIEPQ